MVRKARHPKASRSVRGGNTPLTFATAKPFQAMEVWDEDFWANVPVAKPPIRQLYDPDDQVATAARADCLRAAAELLAHADQRQWAGDHTGYTLIIAKARWLERRCFTGQFGKAKRRSGNKYETRRTTLDTSNVVQDASRVAQIRANREARLAKRCGKQEGQWKPPVTAD